MVRLNAARLPEGLRVYAIGDVHGCLDQLREAHEAIAADLALRPVADWRIVHVGDYVDRGADSRGVLDFLIGRAADARVICLLGNHDLALLDAMHGRSARFPTWTIHGGAETLCEYGVDPSLARDSAVLGAALREAVPEAHGAFIASLPRSARFGDYFFAHAGIDPERGLDDQDPDDLIWIRGPFLNSTREYEAIIVHGHTPVAQVEVRANRIGIDTGAVFGRALTCLVLEGGSRGLLRGPWIEPIVA